MGGATPLTLSELAAGLDRIGGFERQPRIAVAVSGGPDSMALALVADRWARQRGGAIHALTVDHELRTGSAAEARQVAAWLGARSIGHETLVWTGAKPTTHVQEAARKARYRLLAGWCAARGVLHLMTAHQREDQAETHLIRRRAGSGSDGLAAMAAVRELPGCRLVRPLLGVPRARLAAVLAEAGQPFLDDPSNRSPLFERGRMRTRPDATDNADAVEHAIAETERCAAARTARERELDALLAHSVSVHPAGFAALDLKTLGAAPAELAERLLARVAVCFGGLHYPPRRERVARLRAALLVAPQQGRTLGGCRFICWRGRILVGRELAAAAAPVRLGPRDELRWDRRFVASLPSTAPGPVTLGYRGQFLPANGEAISRSTTLPRLIWPLLPVIADEAGALSVPALCPAGGKSEGGDLRLAFHSPNPLTDAGHAVV